MRSAFAPVDGLLLVGLACLWGFSFLFIKVAVTELPPLWVVAARSGVATVVLLAISGVSRRRLPASGAIWGHLVVVALVGNAAPWTLMAWAHETIPSGLGAVLNALTPASTLVIAALARLEVLTARKLTGLGVALGGSVVIVAGEVGAPGRLSALLAVIAGTGMYAIGAVYAKRFVSGRARPMAVATGQVAISAVVMLPAAWLVGPTPRWADVPAAALGSVAALGLLGTAFAFVAFYALIERVGATNATMVTYLIPVVGLLAGWLILSEAFGPHVLIGAAVIVFGIWLAQRERVVGHTMAGTGSA